MTSAVLRLVAKSDKNTHNYASQLHTTIQYTNVNSWICRVGDICLVESILIPNSCSFDLFDKFEIIGGNIVLWSIPFYLLIKLSHIKKTKKYYVVNIPKNIYSNNNFDGILLRYFGMCSINFCLRCKSNIEYTTIFKYNLLDSEILNHNNSPHNQLINNFKVIKFTNTKNMSNISTNYLPNSTGIFIKTNKKLNLIQFNFSTVELFKYDNFMIKYAGKQIYKYKWTNDKKLALIDSLLNFVPMDMINIINDYAKENTEYLYWIPFEPHELWTTDKQHFIKLDLKEVSVNFDSEYTGIMYFMHSKMIVNGWGANFSDEELDVTGVVMV